MNSDYVDNWEALPPYVQHVLSPIIARFDEAADLLFDRRLNLSFEAAVKELSIPGIVALTEGLRALHLLLTNLPWEIDMADHSLLFDSDYPLTVYDLPIYTPCVYLSQLAQYMDSQNVRVWRESTAIEIVDTLLVMARFVPLQTETARVVTAALHDMMYLYPGTMELAEDAPDTESGNPSAIAIAETALRLANKRNER